MCYLLRHSKKNKETFLSLFSSILFKFINFTGELKYNWLPWWLRQYRICLQCGWLGLTPGSGRSPNGRQPTPVFLPGEFYGQPGDSSWDHKESDMTERLTHTQTHIQLRLNWNIYSILITLPGVRKINLSEPRMLQWINYNFPLKFCFLNLFK